MTEEEKKAIETVDKIIKRMEENEKYLNKQKSYLEGLLADKINKIIKLQKENEELKEKNDNNNVYKDLQEDLTSLLKKEFIPKDKIRELLENNYDISTENSRSMSYDGAFDFVEDIEELLEEE